MDSPHTGSDILAPDDTIWKFRGVSSPYGESGSLGSKRRDEPEQITTPPTRSSLSWTYALCIPSLYILHVKKTGLMSGLLGFCYLLQSRSRCDNISCCFASSLTSPHPHFPGLGHSKQSVSALILSQGQKLGAWPKPNSKPAPGPLLRERWNSEFPPLYLCLFKHAIIFFTNSWY